MTFETALRTVLATLGVDASPDQVGLMRGHFELMAHWNRRMNLTAVRDGAEAARRHFGEAAFLHRELPAASTLVDVGSGAGFPGLPVAVLRPQASVTLVESKRRKAAFLRAVARDMPNVNVAECRVENWTGTADWALLRAISPATVLPSLVTRVSHVAILGTDRPADSAFGGWNGRSMPWSDRQKLWLGKRLPSKSRECFT